MGIHNTIPRLLFNVTKKEFSQSHFRIISPQAEKSFVAGVHQKSRRVNYSPVLGTENHGVCACSIVTTMIKREIEPELRIVCSTAYYGGN